MNRAASPASLPRVRETWKPVKLPPQQLDQQIDRKLAQLGIKA